MILHVLSIYESENVLPTGEIQFARRQSAVGNFGLEARWLRLVDRIMGTCRRCRSGFPGTRSNANSIVAGSKSYLSRMYTGPSSRRVGKGNSQSPPGLMPSGANKV